MDVGYSPQTSVYSNGGSNDGELSGKELNPELWSQLPLELINKIFSEINGVKPILIREIEGEYCLVSSKNWICKAINPPGAIGADKLSEKFGEVEEQPRLPQDIDKILASPCKIFPGKLTGETHTLFFLPKTINVKPLTVEYAIELLKEDNPENVNDIDGYALEYYGNRQVEKSCWVLVSNALIPETKDKSFKDQKQILQKISKDTGIELHVPTIEELVIVNVFKKLITGDCQYQDLSRSQQEQDLSRSQQEDDYDDQLCLGGFASGGLLVHDGDCYDDDSVGVVGLWKFC